MGKNIENRRRNLGCPEGLVYLHAAKGMTGRDYDAARQFSTQIAGGYVLPPPAELERGGIVGVARFGRPTWNDDATDGNRWRMAGQFGYPLTEVRAVPFVPCAGALGFWRVPVAVLERLGEEPRG